MSLELRRQEDGRLRDHWYARYEVHWRRFTVNLGVKVSGAPPASCSLREEGDMALSLVIVVKLRKKIRNNLRKKMRSELEDKR